MSIDALTILETNFNYVKNVLTRRSSDSDDGLTLSLFEGAQNSADVFRHGTNTLYHYSHYNFTPPENIDSHPFQVTFKNSLVEQLINEYEQALTEFRNYLKRATAEDLEKHTNLISILVMHLIGHVGQALRLQKLYLEHCLSPEIV